MGVGYYIAYCGLLALFRPGLFRAIVQQIGDERGKRSGRLVDTNVCGQVLGTFSGFARCIRMPQHETQERAERLFKAREQQKADAPKAMAEYQAAIQRVRDRTDELRRQRLAREAQKEAHSA